jgi:hypothetical protein
MTFATVTPDMIARFLNDVADSRDCGDPPGSTERLRMRAREAEELLDADDPSLQQIWPCLVVDGDLMYAGAFETYRFAAYDDVGFSTFAEFWAGLCTTLRAEFAEDRLEQTLFELEDVFANAASAENPWSQEDYVDAVEAAVLGGRPEVPFSQRHGA